MKQRQFGTSLAGSLVVISLLTLFAANNFAQDAAQPASQKEGAQRTPEHLRHKDRAVDDQSDAAAEASVQHNESDLEFTKRSASKSGVPVHNPEWTDARQADPAMKESGEKAGTTDISIGVGESKDKKKGHVEAEYKVEEGDR